MYVGRRFRYYCPANRLANALTLIHCDSTRGYGSLPLSPTIYREERDCEIRRARRVFFWNFPGDWVFFVVGYRC